MWRERRRALLLLVAGAALGLIGAALASAPPEAALKVGFYHATCPIAEDVVLAEMRLILMEDATVAPSLLRMHYHDCFVQVSKQASKHLHADVAESSTLPARVASMER